MVCLTSARFNMKADILRQTVNNDPVNTAGEWVNQQDPESGEIIRVWSSVTTDDPDTPEDDVKQATFRCLARGIIDGGIRVAGTTERWSEAYENVDYVRIWFPAGVRISKRDQITNIRGSNNQVIWREEEEPDSPPSVFSVTGVTPIVDPFGRHIENMALLERAEIQ